MEHQIIEKVARLLWENNYILKDIKIACGEPYIGIGAASWRYKPLVNGIYETNFGRVRVTEIPPKIKEVINPDYKEAL